MDASQAGGFWLEISASTFTNEGFITAESGSTLDLGDDGGTETITNTGNGLTSGAINIDSSARLAISGDFTVAGTGYISFKGAGADITSDGAGATTFTNDSTIVLEASLSSSGAFSGQIGDQGVLSVNDLTFVNDGTAGAEGSGYESTINTGGNTITNGSNGVLEAVSGATLAILSNITNQGVIQAGSSSSSSFGATTGTVDLGKDGGTESMNDTGAVAIYAGSDLAIGGNYTITSPSSSNGINDTIQFKGAGGDIISNGPAPVFTNASTIEAFANGQIGDQGILPSNHLTFDNSGTAGPSGAGDTLTINTGANTVLNTGTLVAEDSGILAIVSNVNNQGGAILAGTPSSNTVVGATTGTVDLGADGGAGSTTNTGVIGIYANSDLAISGNYTVTGSGDIGLKGAGAEITSDGTAATFTNASTIDAFASGHIGDSHLTFVNTGSVFADDTGVTLMLNTGANTISDGGGLLEAENGATLVIDFNVDTGQPSSGSPPGGTVEAGSGGTVILGAIIQDGVVGPSVTGQVKIAGGTFEMLSGSSVNVPIEFTAGGTLELLGAASVSVSGSNGAITAVSGDVIALTSGTGDTVTGTAFTVNASSGTGVTVGGNTVSGNFDAVDGSNAVVGVLANSRAELTGSSDTVTMASGGPSHLVVYGSNDTISAATGDVIYVEDANSNLTVSGSNLAIIASTGDVISLVSGTGDTVTGTAFTVDASSGTGVTVGGNTVSGNFDAVDGSNADVGVLANSRAELTGSSDTVTMASGGASHLVVSGSNDTISAATGDVIYVEGANSNLTVSGSNLAIIATTGDVISLISGTGDTVTGTAFTVNASSGTGVTVGGNTVSGNFDAVDGSNADVGVLANSRAELTGSSDTVTMASGGASHLVVYGSNDTISVDYGRRIASDLGDRRHGHGDGLHRRCVERNRRDGWRQHRVRQFRRRRRLERRRWGSGQLSRGADGSSDTVTMASGGASHLVRLRIERHDLRGDRRRDLCGVGRRRHGHGGERRHSQSHRNGRHRLCRAQRLDH